MDLTIDTLVNLKNSELLYLIIYSNTWNTLLEMGEQWIYNNDCSFGIWQSETYSVEKKGLPCK